MRKIFLALFVIFGLVIVGMALAYHFGGLWGLLGAIVAALVLLWFSPKLVGWIFLRKFRQMLGEQGVALRGATIEVHSITAATELEMEGEDHEDDWEDDDFEDDDFHEEEAGDDEEDFDGDSDGELIDPEIETDPRLQELVYRGPREWLFIDLTVYPALRAGGQPTEYERWNAGAVALLGPKVAMPTNDVIGVFGAMSDSRCVVERVEIWQDDEWAISDTVETLGPQRIRLLAGVKPGLKQLDVTYFTEKIGTVTLPAI